VSSNLAARIYQLLDFGRQRFRVGNTDATLAGEKKMVKTFSKFIKNESGATAIEYGLIAAGISLAIIAVVNGLGTNLSDKYTSINTSLK
jgi:pilus assembly protein Flp/PilA